MMKLDEIEKRLLLVLTAFQGPIPAYQLDDMRDLCRAGEPGVALENFATQLDEYSVPIRKELFEEIATLGKAMNLDPKYFAPLRERLC